MFTKSAFFAHLTQDLMACGFLTALQHVLTLPSCECEIMPILGHASQNYHTLTNQPAKGFSTLCPNNKSGKVATT